MFAFAFVIFLGGHSHSPVTAVVLDAVCYVLQGPPFTSQVIIDAVYYNNMKALRPWCSFPEQIVLGPVRMC